MGVDNRGKDVKERTCIGQIIEDAFDRDSKLQNINAGNEPYLNNESYDNIKFSANNKNNDSSGIYVNTNSKIDADS